jgi:hypothetical protein
MNGGQFIACPNLEATSMLTLAGLVILSVTIWVCSRNLVKAVEAQGNQVHEQGQELRLQLAAVNRVLLDGLKPDWWVELTRMMKELDEASNAERKDNEAYDERLRILVGLQFAFLDEVIKIPLHAVDPYLWALVKEASDEWLRARDIKHLLNKGDSLSGDERAKRAEQLLRECQESADEASNRKLPKYALPSENDLRDAEEAYSRTVKTHLESLHPCVGQHDLIGWFRKNLEGLSSERSNLQRKLQEFVNANAQPKK